MVFGIYPFDGQKDSEIIKKIMKEEHTYPTDIPISNTCKLLIDNMLEKNQQLRIELSDILFEKWFKGEE